MSPPDCGDNSCLYAQSKGGMRTNHGCRCDDCPVCGGTVRPGRPVGHFGWCTQQRWIPDHHRATPRAAPCAPPTHHAFDIDIYDCPCGHMYGDHDYSWLSTAVHPEKAMVIVRCTECWRAAATRNVAPEQNQSLGHTEDVAGKSPVPENRPT